MSMALTTTEDRAGLINRISDVALQMLLDKRIVNVSNTAPIFQAWPRDNRLVILLDPLQVSKPDSITQPTFVRHLSLALRSLPVSAISEPVLAIQVGFRQLESHVLISKPLDLSKQPSPLHVPIGVTRRGDLWLSIIDMDSVLIGGLRRMGKTNLLHAWIQALDHGGACEMWVWDGKPNNQEFRGYASLGTVELIGYDHLYTALIDLKSMLDERSALFADAGVENLSKFNDRVSADRAITPIILIIDEAAEINHLPHADDILTMLGRLIAVGGAYGIHPVIATQKPNADSVRTIIKSNLGTRIALPVANNTDSRLILDRGGAEKIDKQRGRLLILNGSDLIECHAFYTTVPDSTGIELPARVTATAEPIDNFTPQAAPTAADLALALRCKQENNDRFTEEWLRASGYSQDQARELRSTWRAREWVMPSQNEPGKPLKLSEYIYALMNDFESQANV